MLASRNAKVVAPTTITLLDEVCTLDWATRFGIHRTGQVIVDGKPIAPLTWRDGAVTHESIERAVLALRSFRASGSRWSVYDRRRLPAATVDLHERLKRVTARTSFTFHAHHGAVYWAMNDGELDVVFMIWEPTLARHAAHHLCGSYSDLSLGGALRRPRHGIVGATAA